MLQRTKQFFSFLYTGLPKTKAVYCGFCGVAYIVLCLLSGANVFEMIAFSLAVIFCVLIPGMLFTALLKRTKSGELFTDFTFGLTILLGTAFFAVTFCLSRLTGIMPMVFIMPFAVSGFYVFNVWKSEKVKQRLLLLKSKTLASISPSAWLLLLLVATLIILFAFQGVIKYARPSAVGNILMNQDMLWGAGSSNAFKLAFPPQDIRFYGIEFKYHYLTEVLIGGLSAVSGADCYNIKAFYLQPLMLICLVYCLYKFGMFFYKQNQTKSLLFTFSMFLFGCASLWKILTTGSSSFHNSNTTHLLTNINAQATAIVFLAIFLMLFLKASRLDFKVPISYLALTIFSFVILSFAKGPIAAIVACGVLASIAFKAIQKKCGIKAVVLAGLIVVTFIVLYTTMFSVGASGSMNISAAGTLEKGYFYNILNYLKNTNHNIWLASIPVLWVVQALLMMPAAFLLYAKGLLKDIVGVFKLDMQRLLCNACAIGGLAGYFLFNHPNMSQVYFLFLAIFFINLLAVDQIDSLKLPSRADIITLKQKVFAVIKVGFVAAVLFFAAVGFATQGFLYVNFIGGGTRQLLRNYDIIPKYPYECVMTPEDEQAALWLRENITEIDEKFATNRIHTGARLEGIANLYSGLSGRQAFMEGHQYAQTSMGASAEMVKQRIAENETLFGETSTREQIMQICAQHKIGYLLYSSQQPGSNAALEQYFEKVFTSETVTIYKLP